MKTALDQYKQLRMIQRDIHGALFKRLTKQAVKRCAQKMGFWKKGSLVFERNSGLEIFSDYCLYDDRPGSKNVIERYLAASETELNDKPMEKAILEAMVKARYSIFRIVRVCPGKGIDVQDLLREGDAFFVYDLAMSHSGRVNLLLAGRVVCPQDIRMFTGAAMPLDADFFLDIDRHLVGWMRKISKKKLEDWTPQEASRLSSLIIRHCLQMGASQHIRFDELS